MWAWGRESTDGSVQQCQGAVATSAVERWRRESSCQNLERLREEHSLTGIMTYGWGAQLDTDWGHPTEEPRR